MPGETPVLILTGPPGAGKTTAAAALVARFPRAVHLESDRFFQFVRSGYVEPWKPESREQNRLVMGSSLRAPLAVCAERLRDREGAPGVDSGALEQLWRSFADVGAFEPNVLELDGQSPNEVSEILARRLDDGQLLI